MRTSAYIKRYRAIRQALSNLQNAAVRAIPNEVFETAGRQLGMLEGNDIYLNTRDESAVLVDHCIYDIRRDGMNVIEKYCEEHPPPAGTDEELLVEPIKAARYTLLSIRGRVAGKGVDAWDEFREESVFLTDESFSWTVTEPLALAIRLVHVEGYTISTGAALPLTSDEVPLMMQCIKAAFPGKPIRELAEHSSENHSELATLIIWIALQTGASSWISYLNPGTPAARAVKRMPTRPQQLQPRILPNAPCYCGSGRKFKNCCGRPR